MNLKKIEKRESLNIKITQTLNLRLKRARETARKNDLQFNVSRLVEEFLEKELKKIEKELLITQDINEEKRQTDIFKHG